MRAFLVAGSLCVAAQTAVAEPVTVSECFNNYAARIDAIAEPWEENTAVFANGDVRIALIDMIEPAAAAFSLVVLSPPYDEVGGRTCQLISRGVGLGWTGLDFGSLKASYDPATGLNFEITGRELPEITQEPITVRFTLNQASGQIVGNMSGGAIAE